MEVMATVLITHTDTITIMVTRMVTATTRMAIMDTGIMGIEFMGGTIRKGVLIWTHMNSTALIN